MYRRRDLFPAVAFAAAGCSSRGYPPVRVGSKDTPEQRLLGEIVALHLSSKLGPGRVERHLALGDTRMAHEAALAGQIDLYPEYAGIALCNHLQLPPAHAASAAIRQISSNYPLRYRFEWVSPFGYSNPPVAVIPRDRSESASVRTLKQAVSNQQGWALGFAREYEQRADGLPLLLGSYSLKQARPSQVLPDSILFDALSSGQITMAIAERTDPRLDPAQHVVLDDDAEALPPYDAALVVRIEALETNPDLLAALNQLSGKLTTDRVRRLRAEVQIDRRPAAEVAHRFLRSAGL